jgi:blue light- and temperature-responsive anti-repressor
MAHKETAMHPDADKHTRLAYRSQATRVLSSAALAALLQQARQRNRALGITGLLVADGARFMQWLEGPGDAVHAVWSSIRRDARHGHIEQIAVPRGTQRLFADWQMRLACGALDRVAEPAWRLQRSLLDRLQGDDSAAASALCGLASASSWPAANDLAHSLVGAARGMTRVKAGLPCAELALRADNSALDAIEAQVFDATQQLLGQWWAEDRCSETSIVIAQGQLMSWAHAVMATMQAPHPGAPRVLVCPVPGERHLASVALAAHAHARAGAAAQVLFAQSDDELLDRLRSERFDVLQLCLSDVVPRESQWPQAADLLARARNASREPRLAVLLRGRAFTDQPGLGVLLGADDAYAPGALDAAALASLVRWCRARASSPAAMAAQSVLMDMCSQLNSRRPAGLSLQPGR